MNRKRLDTETFEEYREALKVEADRVKQHLSGKYVHTSKTYTAEGKPMIGITRTGSFKDE